MSWEQGSATSYTDLLDKLNTFLTKGHTLPPGFTGTGNGAITQLMGTGTSVQETITVTFSSSTAFSVVGSVTGAMGSGTVGTSFVHARCTFTVTAGGTAWVAGDTIQFVMTPPWTALRSVTGSEYIWRAPGNSNQDQIFVGALAFSDTGAGYYNWRLGGFTGFDAGRSFTGQPGACTRPVMPLWNGAIGYWFIADGRHVKVIAKITTQFEHAYLGFLDAYSSPGEWAYPLIVGGSMSWITEPAVGSINWRYSYAGNEHHAYWSSSPQQSMTMNGWNHDISSLRLRKPSGEWHGFTCQGSQPLEPIITPFAAGFSNLRPGLDGTVLLMPIVLLDQVPNSYGEFAGLKAVSGISRGSEDLVMLGRDTYLVTQDSSYTSAKSYTAALLA